MRAVIIGNGSMENYKYIFSLIRCDDYIICADGGLRHAKKLGIEPDIAIGDFDSGSKPENVKTIAYPARKDFTDGELAVDYAVEHGFDEILLLGMSGKRLDHTMANILLLDKCENSRLIDDNNEVRILRSELELKGYKGKTLSIVPLESGIGGVNSSGLEYELRDDTLTFGHSRGCSNVVTGDVCRITAKNGAALIFINNGE